MKLSDIIMMRIIHNEFESPLEDWLIKRKRWGKLYGSANGEQVGYLEYRVDDGAGRVCIHITNVFIQEKYRNEGYGSKLVNNLIKRFPYEFISVDCIPNHLYGAKNYKGLQDKTAKWFEKLGFVTTWKKDAGKKYEWVMVLKRKK